MKSRLLAGMVLLSIYVLLVAGITQMVGCAAMQKQLDAADPANTGNTVKQIADEVHNLATRPSVIETANAIPYGSIALGVITLLTTVVGGLAVKKSATQQGVLNTAQSVTNTTTPHDAVGTLIANQSETLTPISASLGTTTTSAVPGVVTAAPVVPKPTA